MFNLRDFIKSGFIKAIGKMADYQIILNAAGWYDKGVLTEEDLAEIQAAIDEYNSKTSTEPEAPAEEKTLDNVEVDSSVITDEEENTTNETL